MPNGIKNIILAKKIGDDLYDLMVKTVATMVYVARPDDGEGNPVAPVALQGLIETMEAKIAEMDQTLGGAGAESVATQLQNLKTALGTQGEQAAVFTQLAAMNNEASGILAQAKAYTGTFDSKYSSLSAYVDAVAAVAAAALTFKGVVDYESELPDGTEGHERAQGDVYQVRYRGTTGTNALNAEFAFDGTQWVELGSLVDLSAYMTTEAFNNAMKAVTDTGTAGSLVNRIAAVEEAINGDGTEGSGIAAHLTALEADVEYQKDDTKADSLAGKIKANYDDINTTTTGLKARMTAAEQDMANQKNAGVDGSLANKIAGKGEFVFVAAGADVPETVTSHDIIAIEVSAT